MKQVVAKLSALCLSMVAGCAAANCITDTNQSDFQAGSATNVDLTTSPGDVLLARTGGGTGGGSVDQQNTSFTQNGEVFSNSTNTQWAAQTFTAGKSGQLTQVDVNVFCVFCSTFPKVVVGIRATSNGAPGGADLATATFTPTGTAQTWYSATFSAPATVSAGTKYAIVLRPQTAPAKGGLGFSDSAVNGTTGDDVYAGGAMYFSTNAGSSWTLETGPKPSVDGAFRTYVSSGGGTSGYVTAGDLVSSLKDSAPPAGSTVSWDALNWTGSVGSGQALKFQVAASNTSGGPFNFVGPDGTANSYFTTTGASLSRFDGNRYLKYRAFLSGNGSTTPTLASAQACYTAVAPSADLSITVDDGVTTATPGGSVTYSIVAHNAGPNDVVGATVSDTFPAALSCSWTCQGGAGACGSGSGSINSQLPLPAGATVTYTATCSIAANAGGTLTNTASISATIPDPATGNNSDSDSDTLSASTNVAVTMDDGTDRVKVGDVVNYTIDVSNNAAPSNANVTVSDSLPQQLSGGSWVCTAHNGASCGKASGSGNLSDGPTLPAGSSVTYVLTATVVSGNNMGMVDNSVTVKVSGGNQSQANISATDSDVLVIFVASFEGGAKTMTTAAGGGASSTIVLGVDSGLANQAPAAQPITVATGRAPNGHPLFSVQLMRFGGAILMRTLTTIDDSDFSDVSAWQAIATGQPLSLQWQPATNRGDDGFLRVGALPLSANNARAPLAQLQITTDRTIPWLVPIEP